MSAPSPLARLLGGAGARKDTEVLSQPPDVLTTTQGTYLFHRDYYRSLLRIAVAESAVALLLVGIAISIILMAKPQDRFFVSSSSGRIDRILPLDVPVMENNEMFSRVADNIAAAMTFGYLDFEQRRIQVGEQFQPDALQTLQNALIGTGGIEQLAREGKFFSAAVNPAGGGGVLRQGVNGDIVYEWVMQIPLKITTMRGLSGEEKTAAPWMVTVLVQRAKRLEIFRGYTIVRVLRAEATSPAQPVKEAPAAAPEVSP